MLAMVLAYMVNFFATILSSVEMSRKLNSEMLSSVFKAPMNLFFDVVPTGKVLNRFSKDLDLVDNAAFWTFGDCQASMIRLLSIIVLCVCITPWAILTLPIIILCSFYLYN